MANKNVLYLRSVASSSCCCVLDLHNQSAASRMGRPNPSVGNCAQWQCYQYHCFKISGFWRSPFNLPSNYKPIQKRRRWCASSSCGNHRSINVQAVWGTYDIQPPTLCKFYFRHLNISSQASFRPTPESLHATRHVLQNLIYSSLALLELLLFLSPPSLQYFVPLHY